MTRLTAKQKTLLLALAHSEKDIQPTSGQFIRKYHLTSASAVQRSLSALQEKDIVTSNNGQHFIYDYFLYYLVETTIKHQRDKQIIHVCLAGV